MPNSLPGLQEADRSLKPPIALAAARTGAFVHADLEMWRDSSSLATEGIVLFVDAIQELVDKSNRLLIALPILRTQAEHQLISALEPLVALEEAGTLPAQAQLGAGGLRNLLHVLAVGAEDSARHLELRVLLDADEVLALWLRGPGRRRGRRVGGAAMAVGLLRPARVCGAAAPRLLLRARPIASGSVGRSPPILLRPRCPPCGRLGPPLHLALLFLL
mmetsp:Transcript_48450/g.122920  ORF Transcript_48450/g.122920 Transcript_48450/m.122920 type:complete len:218 (+) Transcript_48450:227-880(+)